MSTEFMKTRFMKTRFITTGFINTGPAEGATPSTWRPTYVLHGPKGNSAVGDHPLRAQNRRLAVVFRARSTIILGVSYV
jgi:hypothetical protein